MPHIAEDLQDIRRERHNREKRTDALSSLCSTTGQPQVSLGLDPDLGLGL